MIFNFHKLSKYDWQFILCASILIVVFIFTDLIELLNKEILYYFPKKISYEPYRVFTSILIHADFNHLVSNIFGLTITRYFLIRLGNKSKFFYLKFIVIYTFLNFFIIWIFERILVIFFNMIPNYISLGFSGVIYAFFGFLLLTSIYGKDYFLGTMISLRKSYDIQRMSTTICLIGLIFSFLPGVSLLGHMSGFITGCIIFFI